MAANGSAAAGPGGVFMSNLIDSTVEWLKTPFKPGGSALNWVLFVGLIIVAIGLWQFILIEITRD